MKITIKGYITCRKGEKYSYCADNYAYNKVTNRFAISDGLSTDTLLPQLWSQILVDDFVALQGTTELSIESSQSRWLSQITEEIKANNSWIVLDKFYRGESGQATLISLRFQGKKWYATALGDSFLFFIPKEKETKFKDWGILASGKDFDKWIELSLKLEPVDIGNRPDYYSSRNEVPSKGEIKTREGLLEVGTFFLMTDALATWVLNEHEKVLEEIREKWISQDEFEKSISTLRAVGRLKNDDTSVLIIDIENDGNTEFEYKSVDVQDLKFLIEKETKTEIEKDETAIEKAYEISKEQEITVPQTECMKELIHISQNNDLSDKEKLSKEG